MAKKSKRKPNAAFMKPVQPDAKLAEVVGAKAIPRTEVTKLGQTSIISFRRPRPSHLTGLQSLGTRSIARKLAIRARGV
jgi:hypothetical protein